MPTLAQTTPQTNLTNSLDLLTVSETAKILRVGPDFVIRHFSKRPDVVNLGSPEDVRRHKRQYRVLRIPRSSLDKFLHENRIQ